MNNGIYKFEEVFSKEKLEKIKRNTVLGIDIGSRQGKAVLLHEGHIYTAIEPTDYSMQNTADHLMERLLYRANIREEQIEYLIGTGYGRVSMKFDTIPNQMLTEISCHGMGATYLGDGIKTVLDIGGQDSKIIKVDPDSGQVLDFAMNDKCAAGTGRFLERAAEILGYEVIQIGNASLQAKEAHAISSQCVVFAESEIVSARAAGVDSKDILAGVHASVIGRVKGLFQRIGIEKEVMFTGGVSNNVGMKKALEDMLGFSIAEPRINSVFAGALGAAIFALHHCQKKSKETNLQNNQNRKKLDLTRLEQAVNKKKNDYIHHETGKKKNVAYLCAYTPIEILEAANVSHIRLLHTGSEKEIAAGEQVVSKIACDYTKSFLGGFAEGNKLYGAVDKLYSFYTCSFMASTIQAVNAKYVPASIYVTPRLLKDSRSKDNYVDGLQAFIKDLEELTGETISREKIKETTKKYNRARKELRAISDYRKQHAELLSSNEYQQIALAYYYLPVDELLVHLADIRQQLDYLIKEEKDRNGSDSGEKLRIMLTGGIVTEHDQKVVGILEELGATVVVEDHCSGYTPFLMQVEEEGDVLENLAQAYLGKAPCANLNPLSVKADSVVSIAKDYEPDGVIYYYMMFCPTYGMAKKTIMDSLNEHGYPTLDIAGNYSPGDEGQIKTRIEAFLEMIKKKKKEAKNETF